MDFSAQAARSVARASRPLIQRADVVAFWTAREAGVPAVTITSTLCASNSAMRAGNRSYFPSAHKDKAYSAVLYRRPTKVFQDLVGQGGPNLRLLRLAGASPLEGGIPLMVPTWLDGSGPAPHPLLRALWP